MEPFVGTVIMFAGTFAPRGWAFCDGQLLPIDAYSALFSILGTTYGGDGKTTFALPDLRGRAPLHAGQGPGLTDRKLGESSGEESVSLTRAQLASHTHTADLSLTTAQPVSSQSATQQDPAGNYPAVVNTGGTGSAENGYQSTPTEGASLGAGTASGQATTDATGDGAAHDNMPPFLALNYIIALEGLYPSRN